MLHGFPSSSYDWARVAGALDGGYSLLLPDFLGFGASDKPAEHGYSLSEQADLVEALWQRAGVGSTVLAAHDYAVSVTQELLARRAEGALPVELRGVLLLNGGLYPDLHRPQPVQTALADPEAGPEISARLTADLLAAALAPTFGAGFDAAGDSADVWQALSRDEGTTWTWVHVARSNVQDLHTTSMATDRAGNVYLAWIAGPAKGTTSSNAI